VLPCETCACPSARVRVEPLGLVTRQDGGRSLFRFDGIWRYRVRFLPVYLTMHQLSDITYDQTGQLIQRSDARACL
jgi:hypothetical protein